MLCPSKYFTNSFKQSDDCRGSGINKTTYIFEIHFASLASSKTKFKVRNFHLLQQPFFCCFSHCPLPWTLLPWNVLGCLSPSIFGCCSLSWNSLICLITQVHCRHSLYSPQALNSFKNLFTQLTLNLLHTWEGRKVF